VGFASCKPADALVIFLVCFEMYYKYITCLSKVMYKL